MLPMFMQDRLAGKTGPEHSYTTITGKVVGLTANQVAEGRYNDLWRAKKAHAEAYWKAREQHHSVLDRDVARKNLENATKALYELQCAAIKPKVARCITCNTKLAGDPLEYSHDRRAGSRCPVCQQHYNQRMKYTNPVEQRRSKSLETQAMKDKKNAKHCPKCHRIRPRKSYLVFNDPFAKCEVCRDREETEMLREQRIARHVARVMRRFNHE